MPDQVTSCPLTERQAAIRPAVVKLLDINLGLRDGESLLILNDVPSMAEWRATERVHLQDMLDRTLLARDLAKVAAELRPGCQVRLQQYVSTGKDGSEPSTALAESMQGADVVMALTTHSLSHTRARARASASGIRIASMPGFDAGMLDSRGPLAVDTARLATDCSRMAELLTKAESATVMSEAGTCLTLCLADRVGCTDTGDLRAPGSFGNLPGGEAFVAPVEGSAEGRVIVPERWYPDLDQDMGLDFENGEVVDVRGGGAVGRWLLDLFKLNDSRPTLRSRRNLAELGIGANSGARRPLNILESEKILGTIHVAVGDNSHIGGRTESDVHIDFVLPKPDLKLDGELVIRGGTWVP